MGYKVNRIMLGTQQVRPGKITQTYTISNIPTNDSNVYLNVSKSGYTIQSVTFSFTATLSSSSTTNTYPTISSNQSNSSRYGLYIAGSNGGLYNTGITVRGRINGGTESAFRTIQSGTGGFTNNGTNVIEYTINRDGNCKIVCNGNTTSWTATGTELTYIQTIMNISNMNVYTAQSTSLLSGNKTDVTVTYS